MIEVPPLPAGMDGFAVRKQDGSETHAVSYADAVKLTGLTMATLRRWIEVGKVQTCHHPTEGLLVLVDSLWAAIPEEVKA